MTLKILNTIGEQFAPEAKKILGRIGQVDYRGVTQKEFERIAAAYDAAVVGLTPLVDKKVLARPGRLKVIAIPANTLTSIDLPSAQKKGVEVVSLSGETAFLNTITGTAELALGLLIALARFIPWSFDSVKKYEWERERFRGRTLYGKTLGIIGMGRLGKWMARYAGSFQMKVVFYDPYVHKSPVPGCRRVSFGQLLRESDVISLHVHLNQATEKMINGRVFQKMKRGVYLINTAVAGIVDERALLAALKQGQIAGYGADIIDDLSKFNTKSPRHPLVEYVKVNRNVIIVPRTGGMTYESRTRTDVFIAEKLARYLKHAAGN